MPHTATSLSASLASILAADRVLSDPSELAAYAVDEVTPGVVAKPSNAEQAAEIVKFALYDKLAVIPVGSRSKLGIGNVPARYDIALDLTALDQIAHYDPGDLTLSVDAGCTLRQIGDTLLAQQQFLPLSGAFGFQSTVAGTIASGIDSPLRQFYGTARDFLVGAEFVDGTGAQVKSGGRVVKNVTGYDLHKLFIGSLGTLGIITRLNFRTFPAIDGGDSQSATFCAKFADAAAAIAFRQKIAASVFTFDAVEIVSPELVRIVAAKNPSAGEPTSVALGNWFSPEHWHVVVQYHGTPEVRGRYEAALREFAVDAGANTNATSPAQSEGNRSSEFGSEARTMGAFVNAAPRILREASPGATIFKIAQLPAKLPELFNSLSAVADEAQIPHALFAHGLGITYFALLPPEPLRDATVAQLAPVATKIFAKCAAQSATAQIQFAPTPLKRHLNILGLERPDFAAMRRLKSAFDPHNTLAPGRLF
jgi:glycolate dehydrogenase FAD-binding subunit